MERVVEQVTVIVENNRALTKVNELKNELENLHKRLNRLGKLETTLEGQSHKKQENLIDQLKRLVKFQEELRTTARQNREISREERQTLRSQFEELERQKRHIVDTIKLTERRGKALSHEIVLVRRRREALVKRVTSLREILEITDEVELDEQELVELYERTYTLKKPVAEEESNLRKQVIDLVFRFHLPERRKA